VGVDADDPKLAGYRELAAERITSGEIVILPEGHRPGMVMALNLLAAHCLDRYEMLAFMGDDHLPQGDWADHAIRVLRGMGTGMVYGDDGIQGPRLPTAIVMTAAIVEAIGYMAPPRMHHLWVDNAWLELGIAAHCLTYLPHMHIQHLHPSAGLSDWDDGYRTRNSSDTNSHDMEEFRLWQQFELPVAAKLIRDLANERSVRANGDVNSG
jgi:hypothetical protein